MAIGRQLKQALAEWRRWSQDMKPDDAIAELKKQRESILEEIDRISNEIYEFEYQMEVAKNDAKEYEERIDTERDNLNSYEKSLVKTKKSLKELRQNEKVINAHRAKLSFYKASLETIKKNLDEANQEIKVDKEYVILLKEEQSKIRARADVSKKAIERHNAYIVDRKRKYLATMANYKIAEESIRLDKLAWMQNDEELAVLEEAIFETYRDYHNLVCESTSINNMLDQEPEQIIAQKAMLAYNYIFSLIPQWVTSQSDESMSITIADELSEEELSFLNRFSRPTDSVEEYLAMESDLLQEPEESSTSISSPQADPRVH